MASERYLGNPQQLDLENQGRAAGNVGRSAALAIGDIRGTNQLRLCRRPSSSGRPRSSTESPCSAETRRAHSSRRSCRIPCRRSACRGSGPSPYRSLWATLRCRVSARDTPGRWRSSARRVRRRLYPDKLSCAHYFRDSRAGRIDSPAARSRKPESRRAGIDGRPWSP